MDPRISIRRAEPGEAHVWARLRAELWPEGDHPAEVRDYFAGTGLDSAPVFLAIVDGVPVGFAEVTTRKDYVEGATESPVAYLEGWYVRPEHRSRDIGRALLSAAEEWATRVGFTQFASDAEVTNHESIAVHHACGFREVNRTVHFIKTLDSSAADRHAGLE